MTDRSGPADPSQRGTDSSSPLAQFATSPVQNLDRMQLSVRGDVDLATRDALTDMGISALGEPSVREVVIDLGCVTFLDASGLGSLVTIRNASHKHGKNLVLSAVPARIVRLLELTNLLGQFTISTASSEHAPQPPAGAPLENAGL